MEKEATPLVAKHDAGPSAGSIGLEIMAIVPAAVVWLSSSTGLSLYNSWVLNRKADRFPYPFFYTMWHMVAEVAAYTLLFVCKPSLRRPSMAQARAQWKMLLVVAVVALTDIGATNSALVVVSITLQETLKGLTPIITLCFAWLCEGRRYRAAIIASLVALAVFSVFISIGSTNTSSTTDALSGVLLTLVASIAAALRPVVTAMLMVEKASDGPLI